MIDDSRLYIKEEYVAINKKFENNYVECAKAIAHEYRHIFQLFYVNMFNDDQARRWKNTFENVISSENADIFKNVDDSTKYVVQEIEVDAFAFTKFYLEKYEGLIVNHPNNEYEKVIRMYIDLSKDML